MNNFLIFFGLCLVVTASPGPAVFLAIKNGAHYGLAKACVAISGNVMAMLTMAAVSALGLGAVILASVALYSFIKVVGGLYLIYIGIQLWRKSESVSIGVSRLGASDNTRLFREAYFVGISNPKAIAFYTALFPQFIDSDAALCGQFIMLASTFAVCSFSFLALYALLASRLRGCMGKASVMNYFNRICGGIFAGLGVILLLADRQVSES